MFYKIPDLHALHTHFLDGLRRRTQNWDGRLTIGDHFRIMVSLLQQPYGQSLVFTHGISPYTGYCFDMCIFSIYSESPL